MASTVASPTRKKAAMASATSVSPRRIAPAVRIRRRVMPLHSVRMSPQHLRMRAGPCAWTPGLMRGRSTQASPA